MYALDLALKSSILLALAAVANWLARRKSASVRHLILSLAFAGILMLPLASAVLPAIHLRPRSSTPAADVLFSAQATVHQPLVAIAGRSAEFPMAHVDWGVVLGMAWAGGAVLGIGQILIGWYRLERLRLSAPAFGPSRDGVDVLEGESGSMPITYGLWRPVVFLPKDAKLWTEERLNIVMRHEMAHVRRGDSALHVIARIALSVHWWNPLAWFTWREFLREQERAADDSVLNSGVSGPLYAEHLLEIARSMQTRSYSAGLAMASSSQLGDRMASILDSKRDRRMARTTVRLVAVSVAAGLVMPLAALTDANPGSVPLGLKRADEVRDKGRFDEAKKLYSEFLSGNQSAADAAKGHIHRGVLALLMQDYPSAASDFEAAVGNNDTRSEAFMWEGVTNERLKSMDEAQRRFDEAVSAAEPGSAQLATIMQVYSQFLEEEGKQDEATAMRARASDIRNSYKPPAAEISIWQASAVRAGSGVKSPQLESKVEPQYTSEARAAKYSGVVVLKVVVGTDGKTHDIQVVRGLGLGLDEKAMEAVSQWTFSPGTRDGVPVNVKASIEVNFRLL